MATDYYSVLFHAISALDPNTGETRRALYDRARLTVMDAGLGVSETNRERSALEAAIDRIETEMRVANMRLASAPPRASPSDRVESAGSHGSRSPRIALLALFGAAVAIALVGYAVWPRVSATNDAQSRAGASVAKVEGTRSTDGSGDADRSYIVRRQLVYYRTIHPVGTAVIAKSQHHLYLVRPNTAAVRYTIGVGRQCVNAAGLLLVSAKEEWPESRAGQSVAAIRPSAGRAEEGRAEARSGARTVALGDTGHRIYGTNPPLRDGDNGCFALTNEDIIDLYDRVEVGTKVVIN
jgi:lipoprotein-anchoring transpeptidase ErfK/SrfK